MNSSLNQLGTPGFGEFVRIPIIFILGFSIICINGTFVFTFFKSSVFYRDPRYILYVHLVINDVLMVGVSVTLYIMSFSLQNVNLCVCCLLLFIASTTHKNTPLNLAGMAVERYIAICKPLHHPQICTVRRTYVLICLIWEAGFIPSLTDLIIARIIRPFSIFDSITYCAPSFLYSSLYHEQKNMAVQCIYMSLVWIIIVFTYCRVLVTARKMSTDKVSAKKAQSTILLHGVQLLLCMLSYTTPVLDIILVLIIPTQKRNIVFCTYLLTNIVPRLLSPLIYGIRDQTFVKHMRKNFLGKILVVKIESYK
ncbi:odorant receptor 131-2-like [Hoplias malabaricus]|uniref:odorant receptor 131-2-like n=1 Tax=Hoplias malabaricus TaxID=27720 RepID=UPI003461ED40